MVRACLPDLGRDRGRQAEVTKPLCKSCFDFRLNL